MLEEPHAAATGMAGDGPAAGRDAFVGRCEELTHLGAALDAALDGRGSVFLVSGEPGIGKTRLAIELSSAARARDVHVAWGRCWEAGGAPPYWPWTEVLRLVLGFGEHPPGEALGRHATQLARLVPELLPGIEPAAAPADPESGRFLLFDAVAAALRRAAARRPLLVVIDDFHAADRASALLLAFVGRALADCGVVLVGTYRDAEAHSTPDLVDALGELSRTASRVALRGLEPIQVRAILEGSRGERAGDALVERIYRITDGNPFFVRELARLLPGSEATGPSADGFRVPEGIRETVRRRLQPLAPPVRTVLSIAAVAGREFDAVVVAAASGLDMVEFLDLLEPAIAQGIVDPAPGESGRLSFRHALIQETIYEDLTPAVRILRHGEVRDALERLAASGPERYVAELAHHALAAAPSSDDERFVEQGVRAARIAMQRMAFEAAVQLYERTIDALVYARPDERRRCELLLALGEAKEWANDPRSSRAVIEQAAAIARRLEAPDLLARAALAVGAIEALKATASSRCETAGALLVEALAWTDGGDHALRARLRSRLALHYLTSGNWRGAASESAAAIRDARDGSDRNALAHALIARHAVLYGPDHLDERCAITTELLDLAELLHDREFEMRAQALRVVNALEIGDMRTVEEATAAHGRLADESQDPFERWSNLMWRCARALLLGRFDDASRLSTEGYELTCATPGPHAFEVNGPAGHLGQQLLIADTRCSPLPDPSLFERPRAMFQEVLAWHVAKLLVLTRHEQVDDVRAEVHALMERRLVDTDRPGTWLAAVSMLSEAVAALGDAATAAKLYPKLLPYAHHNITVSFVACRGSVSRFLGLLASTLHRADDANRHFADAVAMNRRMSAAPHVAMTLYDHAAFLAREMPPARDVHRAFSLGREAYQIAQQLGMTGLATRCEALLVAHAAPNSSDGELKPREDFELSRSGSAWVISHAGREVVVKSRKGMLYVAELLRHPDRDVHTKDLVALFGPVGTASPESRDIRAQDTHTGDFSEDLVDPKARRAYQRRMEELEEQLDGARAAGDPEELAVLREEHDALQREMSRITALGGRPRRIDDTERVRVAVTRAIRAALAEIANVAPEIGSALARRIRTGTNCRYSSSDPPH